MHTIDLESGSAAASRYLRGETLEVAEAAIHKRDESAATKGYCLVLIEGFPVGWGKWLKAY